MQSFYRSANSLRRSRAGLLAATGRTTEAAAASVFYALFLEIIVYRSLTLNRIVDSFLQTGVITGVVFILVGAGQAFSFLIGFLQIPQALLPPLFGPDPSMLRVIRHAAEIGKELGQQACFFNWWRQLYQRPG